MRDKQEMSGMLRFSELLLTNSRLATTAADGAQVCDRVRSKDIWPTHQGTLPVHADQEELQSDTADGAARFQVHA